MVRRKDIPKVQNPPAGDGHQVNLIYQDPSMSHADAKRLLVSDTDADVIAALVSIGLNESDGNWAQNICLEYLTHNSEAIIAAAVTSIGHIARRHGVMETERVFLALESVRHEHPSLEGIVDDTLDDIDAFT